MWIKGPFLQLIPYWWGAGQSIPLHTGQFFSAGWGKLLWRKGE
jgi:hypothetical protein